MDWWIHFLGSFKVSAEGFLPWATVIKPGIPYFPLNPGCWIGILIDREFIIIRNIPLTTRGESAFIGSEKQLNYCNSQVVIVRVVFYHMERT